MSSAASAGSARRAPRRTQEERSAETRARIVEAAARCVSERGFRGATMTAIAEQGGVTWGAMQHQFGDKEAILDAVLEHALGELESRIAKVGESAPDPALRVSRFAKAVPDLLAGESYRAFLEIQLNRSRDSESAPREPWEGHVAAVLERAWMAAFGDLGLPRRAVLESQRLVFMVLAGMATESMLFPRVDRSRQHLVTLRDTLLRIFDVSPSTD